MGSNAVGTQPRAVGRKLAAVVLLSGVTVIGLPVLQSLPGLSRLVGRVPNAYAATPSTLRVSTDSSGAQADKGSFESALSGTGRYVAFDSEASNLVTNDTNGVEDIFVKDRNTGTTVRVSVDSAGSQANGWSAQAAISADGRYVAFQSTATNLVSGDTNGVSDVFVRDTQAAITTRVSVDSTGAQLTGGAGWLYLAISADGRYVAFLCSDGAIHVRDTVGATTSTITGSWEFPSFSSDGRYLAYDGPDGPKTGTFVWDNVASTSTRVSVSSSGVTSNGNNYARPREESCSKGSAYPHHLPT